MGRTRVSKGINTHVYYVLLTLKANCPNCTKYLSCGQDYWNLLWGTRIQQKSTAFSQSIWTFTIEDETSWKKINIFWLKYLVYKSVSNILINILSLSSWFQIIISHHLHISWLQRKNCLFIPSLVIKNLSMVSCRYFNPVHALTQPILSSNILINKCSMKLYEPQSMRHYLK